jgi:hypothetical protein
MRAVNTKSLLIAFKNGAENILRRDCTAYKKKLVFSHNHRGFRTNANVISEEILFSNSGYTHRAPQTTITVTYRHAPWINMAFYAQ